MRYIHLNPLRRRQVKSLRQLDRYRYSGPSALMGHWANEWQAVDAVLRLFGKPVSKARGHYRRFVELSIYLGKRAGNNDFVQAVLSGQNEKLEARYHLRSQGINFRYALNRVTGISDPEAEQILVSGKQPERVCSRNLLCCWSVRELGLTAAAVSELPGIGEPDVSRAACRGKAIAADNGYKLVETLKAQKQACPPFFRKSLLRHGVQALGPCGLP